MIKMMKYLIEVYEEMIANEEEESNEGDWRIERRNPKFGDWWVERKSPKIGKVCKWSLEAYFDSSVYYVFHRILWSYLQSVLEVAYDNQWYYWTAQNNSFKEWTT